MHPVQFQTYIRLETREDIDKSLVKRWYNTVKNNLPSGTLHSQSLVDHTGMPKNVSLVKSKSDRGRTLYDIPLTRHLEEEEAEIIVDVWDRNVDIDYAITSSKDQVLEMWQEFPEIKPNIKNQDWQRICEMLSKEMHNKWVQDQTQSGWRYGLQFNENEQTNPLLRSWHDLPEKYRKIDYATPMRFVEAMDRLGYVVMHKHYYNKIID